MAEGGGVRKLVLETLSVPVIAEAQVFDRVMNNVENTFLRIESHFKKMQGLSRQLAADLGVLATGISTLVAEAATLAAVDLRNLVAIGESLRLFGAKIGTKGFENLLGADYKKLNELASTLTTLTTASNDANATSLSGLRDIGEQLRLFGAKVGTKDFKNLLGSNLQNIGRLSVLGENLRSFIQTVGGIDLGGGAVNIRVLSVVAQQMNELGHKLKLPGVKELVKMDFTNLSVLGTNLSKFVTPLSQLKINQSVIDKINLLGGEFADSLNNAGKKLTRTGVKDLLAIDFSAFTKLTKQISSFARAVGNLHMPNIKPVIDGLRAFIDGLAGLAPHAAKVDPVTLGVLRTSTTMINALRGLAKVDVLDIRHNLRRIPAMLGRFMNDIAALGKNVATVDPVFLAIIRQMSGLMNALKKIASVDVGILQTNFTAISTAMKTFLASFTQAELDKLRILSSISGIIPPGGRIGGGGGRPPRPPGGGGGLFNWGGGGGGGFVHGGAFAAGSNNIAFQINLLRYGLAGLGIAATIAFSRFDDAVTRSLSMIKSATPQMRRELESVIQALVLSGQSLASPTALAEGFQFLAQSGLDFKESVEAMRLMDQLATVTNMTMQETAETVSTIRHNWNMLANDIPHIADIIVRGGQLSRGGMEQFGEAMARLAPTASHLNLSLEDTAVALTVLGQAGIHGSDAATGLARVLNTLETGVVRNSEVWDQYNIQVADAAGRLLPLPQIFTNIRNAMNRLSPLGQREMFMQLGLGEAGGTGLTRILSAFLNTSRDQFDTLKREIRGADGALKDMFATIQESFGRRVLSLWNTFLMALIKMGQILAPVLSIIIEGVKAVFQAFISIPEPIRNFAAALLVLVPAVWLFGHALVMMPIWLKALDVAMYQLFAVTLASMNPIFWFTLATAALIGFGLATDEGRAAFASMGTALNSIWESLVKVATALMSVIPPFAELVAVIAVPLFQILAIVLNTLAFVLRIVANVISLIPSPLLTVIGYLTALYVIVGLSIIYYYRLVAAVVIVKTAFLAWTASIWGTVTALTALIGRMAVFLTKIAIVVGAALVLIEIFSRLTGSGGGLFTGIAGDLGFSAGNVSALRAGYRGLTDRQLYNMNPTALPGLQRAYYNLTDFFDLFTGSSSTMGSAYRTITPPAQTTSGMPRYLGEFQQTSFSRFAISGPGGLSTIGGTGASAVDNPEWTRVLNKIEENTRDNPAGGPPPP